MKLIFVPTAPFIRLETSRLAADAAAGSNVTLTLENNDGFSDNDFIVIGYEGDELCEMAQINAAVSGATDVRVATLKLSHKAGVPVVKYEFNKRKLYGSPTADGSYTEMTSYGSPKDIQVDAPQGTIFEYTGDEGYLYFKSTYFNSQSSEETDIADAEIISGDQSGRYTTLYEIRKQAGLTENPYIDDGQIEAKRKQAENEINSAIMARYVLPLSEVPALISRICALLGGGYLAYEEFGQDGDGGKFLGEARALLKAIQNGKQRLLASNLSELATNAKVNRINGFPDDSAGDPVFSMSRKF